jgi:DNA-3-methyladenine glycosylase I
MANRRAFVGFDPEAVARFDEAQIASLLADPGIVRNGLKVTSAVKNAQAVQVVQKEFGNVAYIWKFVSGRPIRNSWRGLEEIPARTSVSDAMSKDLKRRGVTFVGSTICYALMQATGMVNDHLVGCFRHRKVGGCDAPSSEVRRRELEHGALRVQTKPPDLGPDRCRQFVPVSISPNPLSWTNFLFKPKVDS